MVAESLLNEALDYTERARLLAARDKTSGAWLHAFPVSSLGLRLDDSSLRVAVGLRLGTTICAPHFCRHCVWTLNFGLNHYYCCVVIYHILCL